LPGATNSAPNFPQFTALATSDLNFIYNWKILSNSCLKTGKPTSTSGQKLVQ
jgi:hypothetical protein